MAITVTAKGWIIETTNTEHGMLEQGGVSGRRELVTTEQLGKIGIVGGPDAMYNDNYVSNGAKVRHEIRCGMPTIVVRKGHVIR